MITHRRRQGNALKVQFRVFIRAPLPSSVLNGDKIRDARLRNFSHVSFDIYIFLMQSDNKVVTGKILLKRNCLNNFYITKNSSIYFIRVKYENLSVNVALEIKWAISGPRLLACKNIISQKSNQPKVIEIQYDSLRSVSLDYSSSQFIKPRSTCEGHFHTVQ